MVQTARNALIWMEDSYEIISEDEIVAGPHTGVDHAGESAAWPWRFWLKNSPFVKKETMIHGCADKIILLLAT